MPKPYTPPTGKLSTKHRDFTEVVRDIRHTVACVVRWRPTGEPGKFAVTALGSGFFVSPEMFLTCNHVMNDPNNPHKDGDAYQLVARVAENGGHKLGVENVVAGTNLFLYPDCDLALLKCPRPRSDLSLLLSTEKYCLERMLGLPDTRQTNWRMTATEM